MKIQLNIEIDITAEEVLELKNGYEKQAEAHRPDPPEATLQSWTGKSVRKKPGASHLPDLEYDTDYTVDIDLGLNIRLIDGKVYGKNNFYLTN